MEHSKCISCGACSRVCKMQVNPVKNCNDLECIRCGQCKKACPTGAIQTGLLKSYPPKAESKTVDAT